MTDKPRIRLNSPAPFGRGVPFWVCKAEKGYPGIGATPMQAWYDWVYINGLTDA